MRWTGCECGGSVETQANDSGRGLQTRLGFAGSREIPQPPRAIVALGLFGGDGRLNMRGFAAPDAKNLTMRTSTYAPKSWLASRTGFGPRR